MRFVHTSDVHLLDLKGTRPHQFLNKRLTGGANLLLARGKKHDGRLFDAIVDHAHQLAADRLVITGDLTNLALKSEFEHVRAKLDRAGLPVTVIPGNHDAYTRGAHRSRRFESYLGHLMQGERGGGAPYPFVQRLDDGVALVGVSTAIPTLPLIAAGRVGSDQLGRLDGALAELAAQGRFRIVLLHHPPVAGVAKRGHDLLDLVAFGDVIARRGAELVLHGHEHRELALHLRGPDGEPVPVHGIASGTSLSTRPGKEGAFASYDVGEGRAQRQLYRWRSTDFVPTDP